MKEGWFEEDHFILFDENESILATKEYGISNYLDGFKVVGLLGWDNFILSKGSQLYILATVPIISENLELLQAKKLPANLEEDERFLGKIKWYTTPIVFGGDPSAEQNIVWVNHNQHRELVIYWNQQYQIAKA